MRAYGFLALFSIVLIRESYCGYLTVSLINHIGCMIIQSLSDIVTTIRTRQNCHIIKYLAISFCTVKKAKKSQYLIFATRCQLPNPIKTVMQSACFCLRGCMKVALAAIGSNLGIRMQPLREKELCRAEYTSMRQRGQMEFDLKNIGFDIR